MTLPVPIVARPNIDLSHHRIHEGQLFTLTTIATGLPASVPKYYYGTSPPAAIASAHVIIVVIVSPGAIFEFFEDAVVSGGTQLFSINNNRFSSELATGTFFEDPIVTSDGTILWQEIIGNSTTGGTGGPKDRDENEIITGSSKNYLLKITPFANNTNLSLIIPAYSQAGPGL